MMMNSPRWIAGFALAASLTGCLETEEEITIRPDGSAVVQVVVEGGVDDLVDGHPIPLGGRWRPTSSTTARWVAGERPPEDKKGDVRLSVEATFDSVAAMPTGYAASDEPYPTAYLQRATSLQIDRQEARTVYTFERRFAPRRWRGWDPSVRWEEEIDKDVRELLEAWGEPSATQWHNIAMVVRGSYVQVADSFVREATLPVMVRGGGMSVDQHEELVAECRAAVANRLPRERLVALYDLVRRHELAEKNGGEPKADAEIDVGKILADLEHELEQTLRDRLAAGLARTGLGEAARRSVRARLEWCITALNHTSDLRDESFTVAVNLPGTVVGGNWKDRPDEGRAVWKFEGNDLLDREIVLRAVSVVE